MTKRILDVGNCGPDHSAIRRFFARHFGGEVTQAHGSDDTMTLLKSGGYDLVLVNRKLDRDYSDGIEIIRQIKADPATSGIPVMLITNYADHQDEAVAAGALRGFGKLEFDKPETLERVQAALAAS